MKLSVTQDENLTNERTGIICCLFKRHEIFMTGLFIYYEADYTIFFILNATTTRALCIRIHCR